MEYWNPTTDQDEPVQGDNGAAKVQLYSSGLSAASPATASVTNSSATVVSANPLRKGLVIVNLGAVAVHFAVGANAAVVGSGVMLNQYGTWVMDSWTFTRAAINAICTTTSTLSIQEFT